MYWKDLISYDEHIDLFCYTVEGWVGCDKINGKDIIKRLVLETWTIIFDILNLRLSLSSKSLIIARSIFAPIVTIGVVPAMIGVTCYFLWEDILSGKFVESIISFFLGIYYNDFKANPLYTLYDR